MADNIIKVTVSSSTKKNVTVSSANVGTEITASSDTGRFWAQTSKNWAVSDSIVDNTDYSSKYYANKAKESANIAQSNAGVCGDIYNSVQEVSQTVFQNIDIKSQEAVTNINNAKTEAVDSINSTKTTILSDIEFVADGEKQEIQGLVDDEKDEIKDLINTGKDELKESIGDIKVLTTLEIGDIGIAPLGIDETKGKRRYLNGQVIIQEQYVQFTDKVKSAVALYPSLACTESEWQTTATMTVGGQVGKFVVDDEAGTIRLPKIIMPIQGLTDLSKLAEIVEAGLPNITGTVTARYGGGISVSGAFVNARGSGSQADGGSYFTTTYDFNASKSNPIYGNSTTVQQEQIQYPYFIQVATGAETEDNIINEIELNNPFSLLDYKYSEYELNNVSWLRSNGQWNSKAVYPAVYDLLLKIYNGTETKAGVSVKLSTETFTDYDFVLNTADETFRLPVSVINSAQGYLYFYVGETVQNANLINAGRIEEHLHSLIPNNSSLIAGYCIPDYSAQIILDSGAGKKTYVAPSKGWFGYNFIMEGNNTGYVKVNDIQVISNRPAGGNYYESVSGLIPIDSGDVIKYYTNVDGAGHRLFNFYPMKGAN